MGRVLYFDAFNGVAGDMVVGALLDLGLPLAHLQEQLDLLDLEASYRLRSAPADRQGLQGVDFGVVLQDHSGNEAADPAAPDHAHHGGREEHSHSHARTWRHIRKLIESSRLPDAVKARSIAVFERLAGAEARVHGTDVGDVHFHEVGGVDSIVDIVGACIGFEFLEVEEFFSSPLSLGGGTVSFSHGHWPAPAPATVEILKGLPTRMGPVEQELTTPTGAAIVAELASFDPPGTVAFEHTGYGAGDRELGEIPNMLRLMLGRRQDASSDGSFTGPDSPRSEPIYLLEATIDDMDAETFGHVLERALEAGALEVFHTPVQMKKSRPGVHLSVLCAPEDRQRLARLLFEETTTLGLRWTRQDRWVLEREMMEVPTEWGPVRVKAARLNGEIVNLAPEYEDLREAARKSGRPLKTLRQQVLSALARPDE